MGHSKFLSFALSFLLLSQPSIFAAARDLDTLCVTLGKSSVPSTDCYGFFLQDPRSRTAALIALAPISVDIVLANAGKMQYLVDTLLKHEANSTQRAVLDECSKDYSNELGMRELNKAKDYVFFKKYDDAGRSIHAYSRGAASNCMDAIHFKKAVLPLVREASAIFIEACTIAELTLSLM